MMYFDSQFPDTFFLEVQWVSLQSVIVVSPYHTHLFFCVGDHLTLLLLHTKYIICLLHGFIVEDV